MNAANKSASKGGAGGARLSRVNPQSAPVGERAPFPLALLSRNPLRWLAIFGPGAVIASLTIGAGELIFSSRAGALFGYRLLWFFLLVLVLKWVLVFGTARHMVLTGAHPFRRCSLAIARQKQLTFAPIAGLNKRTCKLLERCLSFDRHVRPQDARGFVRRLQPGMLARLLPASAN